MVWSPLTLPELSSAVLAKKRMRLPENAAVPWNLPDDDTKAFRGLTIRFALLPGVQQRTRIKMAM